MSLVSRKRSATREGYARAGVSTRPLRCGRSSPRRSTGGARSYTAAPMRWNTCAPAGRRTSPPLSPLGPSRGPVEGRAVEGGARGSNGGDGACARRGGAGAFPATLARGLPLALLEAGSYLRAELQPRTLRGFRRFDFAFRLPFFRPWGTVQRGWCVFAFDARAACARVCVHDGASSLSRHLLSFGRFMRSSRRARPRRGARARIPREPRHASVVTSVVTSVARVLGALSASARLRLS